MAKSNDIVNATKSMEDENEPENLLMLLPAEGPLILPEASTR